MNKEETNVPQSENTGTGYLIVHVTTARGAVPLEGAQVDIRSYPPDGAEGKGDVIASLVTQRDGNTLPYPLPTPPRADSMKPGNGKPYAVFFIEVYEDGYYSQTYSNVPIFDGIVAIQPADLIPLPENERTDSRTPDGQRAFESGFPSL